MKTKLKYEMHCHTGEFGWCAKVPSEVLVPAYAEVGYQGICITNHYIDFTFRHMKQRSWKDKIKQYLEGYKNAQAYAERFDMDIILGVELRFNDGSNNDFLVYGLDEDLLCEYPELYRHSPESFKAFSEAHNLIFLQAHPCRRGCYPVEAEFLDGYEIYNANIRADNNNDIAETLIKDTNLIGIGSSDYHQLEDLARSGCIFYERVRDAQDLVKVFKAQRANSEKAVFKIIR